MSRPAAVTADAIRTTVLAMLAEAGETTPASDARFRRIVSVRKLRARLGAGDPATLSRHLNAIEAELVHAGLAGFAIPDVPPPIAAQMRALWEAAVATQLGDVVRLRHDAEQARETADAARHEAELRTELLRTELADLHTQLAARNEELLGLRLESRALQERTRLLESATAELQSQLANAEEAAAQAAKTHAGELAAERVRYDGLSKQLLRETAHQRETFQTERVRLEAELARAAERLAAFESLRDRLLTELAEERNGRQRAAAEAAALRTVVEQQRQTLALVGTATAKQQAAGGRRPAAGAQRDPNDNGSRQHVAEESAMNPSDWVDTGCRPPQRLPGSVEAALAYLAHAFGHPLYLRWTLSALKRGCPSLADAKREHPAVFALLLEHDTAIEYWERGRLKVVPEASAPSATVVLERVLRQHRRRFRVAAVEMAPDSARFAAVITPDAVWMPASVDPAWLARAGRFANPVALTNTLGVGDDTQAVRLFLRERASHSPHTLRAYVTELRRLATWCRGERLGPFSDLTRQDLMAYRDAVQAPQADAAGNVRRAAPASVSRALAAVSSLFAWWHRTGYLSVNPADGLAAGRRARMTWTPVRFLPAAALAHCDAVAAGDAPADVPSTVWARRRAIWTLYRFAGVRLAELAWHEDRALPHIEVDEAGQWTLHVLGKGHRPRAIPLPAACLPALRAYRGAVGLPADPTTNERLPLIHSERGRALGVSGLYDEVRAVFALAAPRVPMEDSAMRAALERASTHWLRHGYARTLVVDHRVPLPVAQALLGHASVQTTAAYARTDISQLREFVEGSFPTNAR